MIVSSNKDIASLNIKNQILNNCQFERTSEEFQETPVHKLTVNNREVKLITLHEESIYAQNLTGHFTSIELIIFISRHSSESGTPTLSVHTSGNLSEAELGGLSRKVSFSPANAMREALTVMAQLKLELQLDYEVSYEGTHHGPSLDVPTMFAELGSSPRQWADLRAADVVARATISACSSFGDHPAKAVLGIGGPHYNAKFTKIALESKLAFGHIIPKYAISKLDAEMLKQCVERTLERVDHAVLDWKGIKGEDKPCIVRLLDEIGLPFDKA